MNNNITFDVLDTCFNKNVSKPETYLKIVKDICNKIEPVFGESWYIERVQQLMVSRRDLASQLLRSAYEEVVGAQRLEAFAGVYVSKYKELIDSHAQDERRHSKMFHQIIKLTLPEMSCEEAINEENEHSTNHLDKKDWIIELLQINAGELSNLITMKAIEPVVVCHCPKENKVKVAKLLGKLISDEMNHVSYTAKLIDKELSSDVNRAEIEEIMLDTFKAFSKNTMKYISDIRDENYFIQEEFLLDNEIDELKSSFNSTEDKILTADRPDTAWVDLNSLKNSIKNKLLNLAEYTSQKLGYEIMDSDIDISLTNAHVAHYKPGDSVPWHTDDYLGNDDGKVIAMIVPLSHSNEYLGGEIQTFGNDGNLEGLGCDKGTVISFSGGRPHKVTEIQSGERYAFVCRASIRTLCRSGQKFDITYNYN